MSQGKRLNPVNRERAARKFKRNFHSADFVRFTRGFACLFCGGGPSMTAHVLHARGMGGANGDYTDAGPVCFACDRVWEDQGRGRLLKMHGLTWAEVEWRVAEHQRAFAAFLENTRVRQEEGE